MFRFRSRSRWCWGVLLSLSACAPEQDHPLQVDDPRLALTASSPRAFAVEPSRALFSDRVTVTLRGAGFGSRVASVTIGDVAASRIDRINGTTVVAVFDGGTSERVGRHDVTVHWANGKSATLEGGFLWYFDQDPVVFVHGCPLPRQFNGSVTNYVTSKYWHGLYGDLQKEGYPAPEWEEEDHFLRGFDHPATVPAPDNYLNVFVLSEDSRNPGHDETVAPKNQGAGHCGSGLHLADELNAFVERVLAETGASRIDLVVNSGGGLGARWYLKQYGGTARVRDVVFLAAMNHGTEVALVPTVYDNSATWWSPNYEAAREGFPAYACEGQGRGGSEKNAAEVDGVDGRDLQYRVNGCFADPGRLGSGTVEIPDDHRNSKGLAGGVAYLSIYNATFDELIEPTTAACLNQNFPGDCSDREINVPVHAVDPEKPQDTPHGAIRADPEVRALTVCHLLRRSHQRPAPAGNCEDQRLAATLHLSDPRR